MKSFAVSADGSVGVVVLFDSSISVWDLNKMQAGNLACACTLVGVRCGGATRPRNQIAILPRAVAPITALMLSSGLPFGCFLCSAAVHQPEGG